MCGQRCGLAMTATIRKEMAHNPAEFDPRAFLKAATIAARSVCKNRFEAFGSAGQAAKIKVVSLDVMATRYAKGEFAAVIK